MNNSYMDKVYLALELTKLSDANDPETIHQYFDYHLQELLNIDDYGTIEELKEINQKLSFEIESLNDKIKNDNGLNKNSKNTLIKIIKENEINMEPFVYDSLMNILNQ